MTNRDHSNEPKRDWTKIKLERVEGEKDTFVFRDDDFTSLPFFFHFVRPIETIPAYSQGSCRIFLFDPHYETEICGDSSAIAMEVAMNPAKGFEIATQWLKHASSFAYYIQFEFDQSRRKPTQLDLHTTLLSVVSDALLSIDSAALWKVFDSLLRIESLFQEYRLDDNRTSRYSDYRTRLSQVQEQWGEAWLESHRVIERIKRALKAWESLRGAGSAMPSSTPPTESVPLEPARQSSTLSVEAPAGHDSELQQYTSRTRPHSVSVFVSYAHEDDRYREALHKHCAILRREGSLTEWYDKMIVAGEEWEQVIIDQLNRCDMMFVLVSPAFLNSDFCMTKEFATALQRYRDGLLEIVAIIVHPCDWMATEIAKFQALPSGARPISKWRSRDEALNNVVQGIRATLKAMRDSDAGQ
jgi:hypothetical protein